MAHPMVQVKPSRRQRDMSPVHPNAAAIDIGARMHVAAVGPDQDPEPVQYLHRRSASAGRLVRTVRGQDGRHGIHRGLLDSDL